jgi:hypothetical protein
LYGYSLSTVEYPQNGAYLMCGVHPSSLFVVECPCLHPLVKFHTFLLLSSTWSFITTFLLFSLLLLFAFFISFFIHFLSSYSISITSYHSFFLPLNFLETQLGCCTFLSAIWLILFTWVCFDFDKVSTFAFYFLWGYHQIFNVLKWDFGDNNELVLLLLYYTYY